MWGLLLGFPRWTGRPGCVRRIKSENNRTRVRGRRVASVSTPQKPHRGCPRSLALGDRGDSGPQSTERSPRFGGIDPGKHPSQTQRNPPPQNFPRRFADNFPLLAHTVPISLQSASSAAANPRRVRFLGPRFTNRDHGQS